MSVGRQGNFASDNTAPIAAEILAAVLAANAGPADAYGADPLTDRLRLLAREVFETELDIFPVATGTAANGLALASACPPYGAVYCHEHAHILLEECGGPEFFTGGAKLVAVPGAHGKIDLPSLRERLDLARAGGVHHVRPAVVSLTQATEWGTVYRIDEIAAIAELAHREGLKVHLDGARLANAIASLGCTPAAATWQAGVDLLSLGATKNGAMAAEAVIVFDRTLAAGFAERRKRAGQLLSKMRFLSAQLVASLEDGRWLSYAAHANAMAQRLAQGLSQLPGLRLVQPVEANELFLTMPESLIRSLHAAGFVFYRWMSAAGAQDPVVRLVTSFATQPADVDPLVSAAPRLTAPGSAPR